MVIKAKGMCLSGYRYACNNTLVTIEPTNYFFQTSQQIQNMYDCCLNLAPIFLKD